MHSRSPAIWCPLALIWWSPAVTLGEEVAVRFDRPAAEGPSLPGITTASASSRDDAVMGDHRASSSRLEIMGREAKTKRGSVNSRRGATRKSSRRITFDRIATNKAPPENDVTDRSDDTIRSFDDSSETAGSGHDVDDPLTNGGKGITAGTDDADDATVRTSPADLLPEKDSAGAPLSRAQQPIEKSSEEGPTTVEAQTREKAQPPVQKISLSSVGGNVGSPPSTTASQALNSTENHEPAIVEPVVKAPLRHSNFPHKVSKLQQRKLRALSRLARKLGQADQMADMPPEQTAAEKQTEERIQDAPDKWSGAEKPPDYNCQHGAPRESWKYFQAAPPEKCFGDGLKSFIRARQMVGEGYYIDQHKHMCSSIPGAAINAVKRVFGNPAVWTNQTPMQETCLPKILKGGLPRPPDNEGDSEEGGLDPDPVRFQEQTKPAYIPPKGPSVKARGQAGRAAARKPKFLPDVTDHDPPMRPQPVDPPPKYRCPPKLLSTPGRATAIVRLHVDMNLEPDVWETCHPVSEALCKGFLAGAVFGGVSATHCQVDDFCDKKKGCSGPFKKSNRLKPEAQQASLVPPNFTVHAGEAGDPKTQGGPMNEEPKPHELLGVPGRPGGVSASWLSGGKKSGHVSSKSVNGQYSSRSMGRSRLEKQDDQHLESSKDVQGGNVVREESTSEIGNAESKSPRNIEDASAHEAPPVKCLQAETEHQKFPDPWFADDEADAVHINLWEKSSEKEEQPAGDIDQANVSKKPTRESSSLVQIQAGTKGGHRTVPAKQKFPRRENPVQDDPPVKIDDGEPDVNAYLTFELLNIPCHEIPWAPQRIANQTDRLMLRSLNAALRNRDFPHKVKFIASSRAKLWCGDNWCSKGDRDAGCSRMERRVIRPTAESVQGWLPGDGRPPWFLNNRGDKRFTGGGGPSRVESIHGAPVAGHPEHWSNRPGPSHAHGLHPHLAKWYKPFQARHWTRNHHMSPGHPEYNPEAGTPDQWGDGDYSGGSGGPFAQLYTPSGPYTATAKAAPRHVPLGHKSIGPAPNSWDGYGDGDGGWGGNGGGWGDGDYGPCIGDCDGVVRPLPPGTPLASAGSGPYPFPPPASGPGFPGPDELPPPPPGGPPGGPAAGGGFGGPPPGRVQPGTGPSGSGSRAGARSLLQVPPSAEEEAQLSKKGPAPKNDISRTESHPRWSTDGAIAGVPPFPPPPHGGPGPPNVYSMTPGPDYPGIYDPGYRRPPRAYTRYIPSPADAAGTTPSPTPPATPPPTPPPTPGPTPPPTPPPTPAPTPKPKPPGKCIAGKSLMFPSNWAPTCAKIPDAATCNARHTLIGQQACQWEARSSLLEKSSVQTVVSRAQSVVVGSPEAQKVPPNMKAPDRARIEIERQSRATIVEGNPLPRGGSPPPCVPGERLEKVGILPPPPPGSEPPPGGPPPQSPTPKPQGKCTAGKSLFFPQNWASTCAGIKDASTCNSTKTLLGQTACQWEGGSSFLEKGSSGESVMPSKESSRAELALEEKGPAFDAPEDWRQPNYRRYKPFARNRYQRGYHSSRHLWGQAPISAAHLPPTMGSANGRWPNHFADPVLGFGRWGDAPKPEAKPKQKAASSAAFLQVVEHTRKDESQELVKDPDEKAVEQRPDATTASLRAEADRVAEALLRDQEGHAGPGALGEEVDDAEAGSHEERIELSQTAHEAKEVLSPGGPDPVARLEHIWRRPRKLGIAPVQPGYHVNTLVPSAIRTPRKEWYSGSNGFLHHRVPRQHIQHHQNNTAAVIHRYPGPSNRGQMDGLLKVSNRQLPRQRFDDDNYEPVGRDAPGAAKGSGDPRVYVADYGGLDPLTGAGGSPHYRPHGNKYARGYWLVKHPTLGINATVGHMR